MIEKIKNAFDEAFIDFEVGYNYKIQVEPFVIETNTTGTLKQCKKANYRCKCPSHTIIDGKPFDLYTDMYALYASGSTGSYREVIAIKYYFESKKVFPVSKYNEKTFYDFWAKSQFSNQFIKEDLIAFKEDFDYGIQMVNILLRREKISFVSDFSDDKFYFKGEKPNSNAIRPNPNELMFPILFRGTYLFYGDEYDMIVDITSKLKETRN